MATVKKTALPKATVKKPEVKVEVKTEEVKKAEVKEVAPKKEAVKKAPAKKAAAPKKVTAPKKVAEPKKAAGKSLNSELHVQFAGKSYSKDELEKIAKDVWTYDLQKNASDLKTLQLYVKPEESAVYYVMNGQYTGSFYI